MKVLWSVNTIFPYPANELKLKTTVFGGWLLSLVEEIVKFKQIEFLGIATIYNGKTIQKVTHDKVIYYLIPHKNINKYSKTSEKYWQEVLNDFKPDIIHINGTEFPHSLELLTVSNKNKNIKSCVSIQGLVSECGKKEIYNAGISDSEMLSNITFRDIVRHDLLINQYKKMFKRAKYEIEILKQVDYIIGRTSWDKENALKFSKQNNYFVCNENLRKEFYNKNWKIDNIQRHSIFISQASYPIKGFHKVLDAVNILKNKYSDIMIFVAGNDIIKSQTNLKEKLKLSGYGLFLKRKIKKYKLQDNIKFTGILNEKQLCEYLKKANVFLQASVIENSSNALGEAMIIGMPIVASNVGGTKDMIKDELEGLLYNFGDINNMVNCISTIFENDNQAIKLGKKAQIHAKKTHDREKNAQNLILIYEKILKNKS